MKSTKSSVVTTPAVEEVRQDIVTLEMNCDEAKVLRLVAYYAWDVVNTLAECDKTCNSGSNTITKTDARNVLGSLGGALVGSGICTPDIS